ncbi:hypothetical protein [Thalassolituus sp. UBA2009]|uniref:hypothetical protein n=1 Tax=Thalassolituus sp. UBA2009 TaxID=1947658 RepID=UPI0025797BFF|nr:hypothetical protein [Thalassolituus sp. UBA2009]
MTIYTEISMVKPEHIREIDTQLKALDSKVQESCLDGQEHSLANVLYLACGGGSFGVSSLEQLNGIGNDHFSIFCTCQNAVTRAR